MLAKKMLESIQNSSAIRAMFVEGKELAAKIGEENVFDFSLGNPYTPVPEAYTRAMIDLLNTEGSVELHGYMDNGGYPQVREAIAENLNRRFGTSFTGESVVMTVGAAGALNIVFQTIFDSGDELLVFAPYFTEYRSYSSNHGVVLKEVKPDPATFYPDFSDFHQKITEKTKAIILNNPVNPSGVLYGEETVMAITNLLKEKQEEYGHAIYLISDEPYRELVYDGKELPFLTHYYDNTFISYSFSKSLSVPGDRIGYVAVPKEMEDFPRVMAALTTANRTLGFINAPALMQKAVARCLDEKTDLDFYDGNRKIMYEGLTKLGFSCVKPEGTFYLFIEAPEKVADEKKENKGTDKAEILGSAASKDAEAEQDACEKLKREKEFLAVAKEHHIILVGGSSFACPGYVRLAYCAPRDKVERSLEAFAKVAAEYGLA